MIHFSSSLIQTAMSIIDTKSTKDDIKAGNDINSAQYAINNYNRDNAPQGQSTTDKETRLQKGIQAQVDIFGEKMQEFHKSGENQPAHINRWLTDNCFGDYYTRKGLDYKQRELITFCFLSAQGGCEPQLIAHA